MNYLESLMNHLERALWIIWREPYESSGESLMNNLERALWIIRREPYESFEESLVNHLERALWVIWREPYESSEESLMNPVILTLPCPSPSQSNESRSSEISRLKCLNAFLLLFLPTVAIKRSVVLFVSFCHMTAVDTESIHSSISYCL
jgi:hypothetical protein